MNTTFLLIGTKKGLFLLAGRDRARWELRGPFLSGKEINHATYDQKSGGIYAAANDAWFGSELTWSVDFGKTWQTPKQAPAFAAGSEQKIERLWHIAPGPDAFYLGVAPAALFRSHDSGQTWTEVTSVSGHPTRSRWFPGAGGLCLHSILLDPTNPQRLFIGISAAGVFRSDDGGDTWQPANRGTRAEFLPDKLPEVGQCVHKLKVSADRKLLFQQNHCGVYRSADGGENWDEITQGLPSDFGFPMAVHPREPETIYVIPLKGAEFRCPPENKLRVFRSRNGGRSWDPCAKGLPQDHAFSGVYREAMTTDDLNPAGIYFGTNTGKIFGSFDEGDNWSELADNLPPVFSVHAFKKE